MIVSGRRLASHSQTTFHACSFIFYAYMPAEKSLVQLLCHFYFSHSLPLEVTDWWLICADNYKGQYH